MNAIDLLSSGNAVVMVSAKDLRDFAAMLMASNNTATATKEVEPELLTPAQAREKWHISSSTLWHWANAGIAQKVKIGGKVFYMPELIKDKLL